MDFYEYIIHDDMMSVDPCISYENPNLNNTSSQLNYGSLLIIHDESNIVIHWQTSKHLDLLCQCDLWNPTKQSLTISAWIMESHNTLIGRCAEVRIYTSTGVGVTKAPFANFSVSKIFSLAKVPVRFPESHSYLTGVTAAELRRHLPNTNVIFNS